MRKKYFRINTIFLFLFTGKNLTDFEKYNLFTLTQVRHRYIKYVNVL